MCVSSRLPFRERARCSLRKRKTQRQKFSAARPSPQPPSPLSATGDVKVGREEAGGQALIRNGLSAAAIWKKVSAPFGTPRFATDCQLSGGAQAAARREGGGWRVAQPAGSGATGGRRRGGTACRERAWGRDYKEESPSRVPRPIQACLVLPRSLPRHPLGPAWASWLGRAPRTGAGTLVLWRLGPRIPRAGALALKCARSGLWQFLLSFHSGYFGNPQSLIGPVSKASNPKSPRSAAPSFQAPPRPARRPAPRR